MQKLSTITSLLQIGLKSEAVSVLRACTIDGSGGVTFGAGNDLGLNNLGGANAASGQFIAEKVWGAVWNDIVDFQQVCDEVVFGKCYYDTYDGAKICNSRMKKSVIGIASDTFGFSVGTRDDVKQVPIAVCGWVLAFTDKIYESGTVLTNDENGNLTEMSNEEKINFPERIVAIFKRPEYEKEFGTQNLKIQVNGRHWVKVK